LGSASERLPKGVLVSALPGCTPKVDSLGSKDRRQNKRGGKACKRSARTAGLITPKYRGIGECYRRSRARRARITLHLTKSIAKYSPKHTAEGHHQEHISRELESRPNNYKHLSSGHTTNISTLDSYHACHARIFIYQPFQLLTCWTISIISTTGKVSKLPLPRVRQRQIVGTSIGASD
jgi:hypothetical protein